MHLPPPPSPPFLLVPLGSSDHCSLRLCLSQFSVQKIPPLKRRIWLYGKADFEGLNEDLVASLGDQQSKDSDVDSLWSRFKWSFLTSVRNFIPSKVIRCRKFKPWVCVDTRHLMRKLDLAHRAAKRENTPSLWAKYRSCRNKVVASLRAGNKKSFDSMSRNHGCLKDFWSKYRSVTKVFHRVPATMTNGSEYAFTDISKATLLNVQFQSTFAPLSPFPVQPPVEPDGLATLDCTSDQIYMTIKMTCSNGISSRMLKGCSGSICEPLAEIFNRSLSSGRLPQDWSSLQLPPSSKLGIQLKCVTIGQSFCCL